MQEGQVALDLSEGVKFRCKQVRFTAGLASNKSLGVYLLTMSKANARLRMFVQARDAAQKAYLAALAMYTKLQRDQQALEAELSRAMS